MILKYCQAFSQPCIDDTEKLKHTIAFELIASFRNLETNYGHCSSYLFLLLLP